MPVGRFNARRASKVELWRQECFSAPHSATTTLHPLSGESRLLIHPNPGIAPSIRTDNNIRKIPRRKIPFPFFARSASVRTVPYPANLALLRQSCYVRFVQSPSGHPAREAAKPRDYFATTQWTMVLNAAGGDSTRAREALQQLCRTYWYPLYAYARRRGQSPEDAEDSTQGFFARLLELDSLADVRREKGKFRSFLLASLNHYLSDEWDRARAQKRGKGQVISLDARLAEERWNREPPDALTPEKLFERKWAMALLDSVVQRLQREYDSAGKSALFMALRFSIAGEAVKPYAELSSELGMAEPALRVAAHRLRQRYRQLLREEIARTVATEAEVDGEIQHLFQVLAG
jgi:RNA polymerase sigma-70 factor (ECF subfamily)